MRGGQRLDISTLNPDVIEGPHKVHRTHRPRRLGTVLLMEDTVVEERLI